MCYEGNQCMRRFSALEKKVTKKERKKRGNEKNANISICFTTKSYPVLETQTDKSVQKRKKMRKWKNSQTPPHQFSCYRYTFSFSYRVHHFPGNKKLEEKKKEKLKKHSKTKKKTRAEAGHDISIIGKTRTQQQPSQGKQKTNWGKKNAAVPSSGVLQGEKCLQTYSKPFIAKKNKIK